MKKAKKIFASLVLSLTLATGYLFMIPATVQAAWNPFSISVEGTGSLPSGQSLWSSQVGLGSSNNSLGKSFGRTTSPKDIRLVIASLIKIFFELLAIIFLVLLLLAGYNYMTAYGDEKKATDALKSIRHAVIGLIIVMAAFAITDYVIEAVLYAQDQNGYIFGGR